MLVDLDVWAGEPARGVHPVRFSMYPRWVRALLFAGVLPFIIGVMLTRRTVTGTLPMNARALRRFVVQRTTTVVIVVCIPVLCFVAAVAVAPRSTDATGVLIAVGFLVIVVGAFVCTYWAGAISIGGTVEDRPGWGRWVRLHGVDPTFAAAVRRYEGRMPQWQLGTIPTGFAQVPLPDGYAPAPPPPGWAPPPWNPGGVSSAPPVPPRAR